jgi:glucosylceramidase
MFFAVRARWSEVIGALGFLVFALAGMAGGQDTPGKVRWICTTQTQPWQEMPVTAPSLDGADAPVVTVDPSVKYQTIIGFGGCFNELAWQALQAVDGSRRDEVLQALFAASGCNFTACREGIGANDFALAWYSLDETPDDYAMDHFNIDEDSKTLIPFIKAAMQYQPKLALWGVPWSPPSWMKTNGQYKGGKMKQDPQTLAAYALYFSKYAQAYLKEGIPLRAVMPQNEPVYNDGVYPQCKWSGQEIDGFLRDYLVPQLKKDQVPVEVWLGTLPTSDFHGFPEVVLGDSATSPSIVGVGYQYGGQDIMPVTHTSYPDKLMLQTETECYSGNNLWSEGMKTFRHIINDTNNFSNGYIFWNMILNEKGTSSWGWRQNSLITVDSQTGKVTYNPEFYALKHFGNLVQPGAVRVGVSAGPFPKLTALQNSSGSVVVLFSNDSKADVKASVKVGETVVPVDAPADSMNAVVVSP